jgi:(p)ppGpp synthase/HD superfamily hydrolase
MTASYAQTNIQLYNQLAELGYPEADVGKVHCGYGLAMQLFTGLYRGSGRPFLSHLVGTASVLAALRAPIEVVTAGLLHSAYSHGEFGNYWRGVDGTKRARVTAAVGEEVEALVLGYMRLPWRAETIGALTDTAAESAGRDRHVLLMRLANELDDHQDLGLLYVAGVERRREFIRTALHQCVEMAERLGHPALALELAHVLDETLGADVPSALRGGQDDAFILAPASHTWRPAVVSRWMLARLSHAVVGRRRRRQRPGLHPAEPVPITPR